VLWKWIDAHEKELGVGRPYLDRDPPHVAPVDGREYAAKRGLAAVKKATLQAKKAPAAQPGTSKPPADARIAPSPSMGKPAKSANASRPERRAGVQR
jgi:hypothetical protein